MLVAVLLFDTGIREQKVVLRHPLLFLGASWSLLFSPIHISSHLERYIPKQTPYDHIVPTLKFSAGVELFIFSYFGVFAEAAYTQHLMPTIIEKAAINNQDIKHPSGPITLSVGLSLFFN